MFDHQIESGSPKAPWSWDDSASQLRVLLVINDYHLCSFDLAVVQSTVQ